jgi:phosphoglycolate phosphatase
MSDLRHVIWDFNGTLLDDVGCCIETLSTLLVERSLPPITTERYREQFGFPVRDFYAGLGFDFAREDFDAVSRTFIDRYLDRLTTARAHDGAHDALRYVASRSLGQSVLSAMEHRLLGDLLVRYELRGPMQHVRGLSDLRASSKVELGRALLDEIDAPASAVVLVGDTLHDYETACAIGCRSVLVAHGHQTRARLERETKKARDDGAALPEIVDALSDVIDWLERQAP